MVQRGTHSVRGQSVRGGLATRCSNVPAHALRLDSGGPGRLNILRSVATMLDASNSDVGVGPASVPPLPGLVTIVPFLILHVSKDTSTKSAEHLRAKLWILE